MRLALGIEYDGTDFLGWQRLSHGRTVQQVLEAALGKVAHAPIEVTCAGRTDSGVHALQQVVHFDTEAERSDYGWMMGCNSLLPRAAAVRWVRPVEGEFHARYSATSRRYRYRILNRPARPGLQARFLTWERRPLDAIAMHQAAQAVVGENDFSAFRTAACQAPHARRRMIAITVERQGEEVRIDVEANAFLHHMVRNLVGSLLPIGRGERPVEWMAELLAGRDRSVAGPTAPAEGLCFIGPRYPDRFGIPEPTP
ncbi:tRNA pseudouridine(38-40) synthase TruA [Pseudomarimonas salicorniae]|uniref:tRNA pseudouridine synthase A n=1 Tax=Pseudomarimonas salicorniae TaxID=2933270 RepID=A0ABT0GKD5_9GAMM|nr:tRNA pseudouridine(38-40) synthase TruA [Lysobacter sp. CAU 1642]MCK7594674.1 tRNA pseudouridine(38-40) synthase TruA [Lysobacter sp. CAU 1642]